MVADVPLGVFLSGGIDSSTVTGMMQAQSDAPVRSFTIGFLERGGEQRHAKKVAAHLGTLHTEFVVEHDDVLSAIPRMPAIYDEPFSDSSQVPTYLVSRLARAHVTVALSGDGGDELFCGYRRYFRGAKIWTHLARTPKPVRLGLAAVVGAAARFGTREGRVGGLVADLRANTLDEMFRNRVSRWNEPLAVVRGGSEPLTQFDAVAEASGVRDPSQRMMLLDLVTYLTDDILVKVDRASMAVSLETRNPLLDHRVVEFALRLPLSMKLRDGAGKWALRQVLARYVPPRLTDRPKSGFGAPVRAWITGPLRDWAEAQLSRERLAREGYLDADVVRGLWKACLSGQREIHQHVWDVLMFQAWLEAVDS
jgi:asparagine synthase (glutamine-hydrolysing)